MMMAIEKIKFDYLRTVSVKSWESESCVVDDGDDINDNDGDYNYLSEARLRAVSVKSWESESCDVDDGDDINSMMMMVITIT